ncbi:uncharacterized protein ACR2FA_004529 [Aphomia sociella]
MTEQLLNLKFVREVEKRPCLYNCTISEYSRRDLTENAWAEVGREVNLTGYEAKEKWKNLRAVFVRRMRPYVMGTKIKSKKPYYLAEAMQFALPYVKALFPNPGEMPIQTQLEVYDENESSWHMPECEVSESVASPQHSMPPGSPQSSSSSPSPQISLQSYQSGKIIQKKEDTDEGFKYSVPWHQPHQSTKISRKEDSQIEDGELLQPKRTKSLQHEANKMFFLSLLPDVDQLTPNQTKTFKRRVIDLVDEFLQDSST